MKPPYTHKKMIIMACVFLLLMLALIAFLPAQTSAPVVADADSPLNDAHPTPAESALVDALPTEEVIRVMQVSTDANPIEESAPDITPTNTDSQIRRTVEESRYNVLQDFNYAELEVIAQINQWRISEGMWPLSPNVTLGNMARSQADYLISLESLPNDLHLDAQGRDPLNRALDPNFSWPHYLNNQRVAVSENIYIGNNVNAAIRYWQNSEIHRRTAVSQNFREIGVAIVPHPYGHIYVAVFGSRPNVLPVLLDPQTDTLFLSSEAYRYAAPGDWLTSVQGLQILPSPLSDINQEAWRPWSVQAEAPDLDYFVIAYRGDENRLVITDFDPQRHIAWLPSNLERATMPSAPLPQVTATPERGRPVFATNTPRP